MNTEFQFNGGEVSCDYTQSDGYYQCIVPSGWTGRVTPELAGYTFDPPFFQGTGLTGRRETIDFQASPG